MDIERALETQRLRLLRLLAGLLAAVVFLSVGPFSRSFSRWVGEGASSILSRAELAARYLVIAQARFIAAQIGSDLDPERLREEAFRDIGLRDISVCEDACSLDTLCGRLKALRALLEELPRYGLRLLRRIEKRVRRLSGAARRDQVTPNTDAIGDRALCDLRLAVARIELPPDKETRHVWFKITSPRHRVGGKGGWGAAISPISEQNQSRSMSG